MSLATPGRVIRTNSLQSSVQVPQGGSAASVSTASIEDLSDVHGVAEEENPIENQVMLYKTSPAGWHQRSLRLEHIVNVNTSVANNNHILIYVAGSAPPATGGWYTFENKLNLCTDVDSVNWGATDDTKVLTYAWDTSTNSGKWTASALPQTPVPRNVISMNELTNVHTTMAPANNDILRYSTTNQYWYSSPQNSATELADLSDGSRVTTIEGAITSLESDQTTQNATLGSLTANSISLISNVNSINTTLSTSGVTDGHVLTYNASSSSWIPAAPAAPSGSLTFIRYYVPSALTIPLDFPSSVPDQISHVNESPRLTPLPYVYNGTGNASDAAYRYPRSRTGGIYSPVGTTIAWPAKPWHPINYWRSMDDATTPKEYITIPSNGHYEVFFRIQIHVADQGSGTSHFNRVILKVEMTRGSTTTVTDAYMEYLQEGTGTHQQESGFHHGTFITQDVIELQQNDQLRALWMFSLVPNRQAYVGVPTTFYVKRIG